MVNMPSIIRCLSVPLSGLALTWIVIQIPGDYAYASVWLMPTLAAFFAFVTWFLFMYHDMAQRMSLVRKPSGSHQQRSGFSCMAGGFGYVGWICVGVGVLSAFIQAISSPTHCSWEFPFAMGIGILIGAKALEKMSARVLKQDQGLRFPHESS
jgi:hypothetical protein